MIPEFVAINIWINRSIVNGILMTKMKFYICICILTFPWKHQNICELYTLIMISEIGAQLTHAREANK